MDKSDQVIFNLNRQIDELSSRLTRYNANEKDIMAKVGPAVAMLTYCSDELRIAANNLQGMQHKCNTYSTQILNQAHILGLIKPTEPLEANHGCDCGTKDH